MNVLIVEPDKQLAQNYQKACQLAGMRARSAHTAQEAVMMVDDDMPDVVVLELLMSGHNGIEFLYELRSYSDWKNLPVVILSFVPVADFSTDEALLQQLGIVEYLYKPAISLAQLTTTLIRRLPVSV